MSTYTINVYDSICDGIVKTVDVTKAVFSGADDFDMSLAEAAEYVLESHQELYPYQDVTLTCC